MAFGAEIAGVRCVVGPTLRTSENVMPVRGSPAAHAVDARLAPVQERFRLPSAPAHFSASFAARASRRIRFASSTSPPTGETGEGMKPQRHEPSSSSWRWQSGHCTSDRPTVQVAHAAALALADAAAQRIGMIVERVPAAVIAVADRVDVRRVERAAHLARLSGEQRRRAHGLFPSGLRHKERREHCAQRRRLDAISGDSTSASSLRRRPHSRRVGIVGCWT